MEEIKFSVFTKPWKKQSLEELGEFVADMGFDAVEYPLRDGYQVEPHEGEKGIIRLAKTLAKSGIAVTSLAAGVDVKFTEDNKVAAVNEEKFSGCAEAGIGIIRICQGLDKNMGFQENIDKIRRKYDAIAPYCEKYGVTLGVQMHYGSSISNSAETCLLLKDYDPKCIAAVWDSGHSGLAGNVPELAIDMVWDHLCMVNFKAAYWKRTNGPEAEEAKWNPYWTTGDQGMGSWKREVDYLKARGYKGTVCLPAEYDDEANVEAYARKDLKLMKKLFENV